MSIEMGNINQYSNVILSVTPGANQVRSIIYERSAVKCYLSALQLGFIIIGVSALLLDIFLTF